jgi:tetratricopeptide (TPR) repeat protein
MQRLIIFLLFITICTQAQEVGYTEIDKLTYGLYEKSDWNQLAKTGELYSQSADYYLFNVRVGVAFLNLREYYKAEKYFAKAILNNSTDFALEYLYWTYINLGQINRAKEIHAKLSDEARNKIPNEKKWIESAYAEGGVKFSNNTLKGNLAYGSVTTNHRINDKLTFVHGFGYINQNSKNDKVSQLQYNIFPSYYLKNGYTLNAGFMYAYNKVVGDNRIDSKTEQGATVNNHTDADIYNTAYHASVSKQYRRLYSELYGFYLQQNFKGTHNNIYDTGTDEFTAKTYIFGVNISYVMPVLQNRFTIGSMLFSASDSDTKNLFVSPYLSVKITDKLWMKTIYYPVNKTLFADKDAGIFFTNNNLKTDRLATILTWNLSNKWQLVGTYSHEKIISDLPNLNHKLNSCFLGINYKF